MSDTECPGGIEREETGHARSGNGRVGANDTISKLIISPPTRPWEQDWVKATLFADADCEGVSYMVKSADNGDWYEDDIPSKFFANSIPIKSVFLNYEALVYLSSEFLEVEHYI